MEANQKRTHDFHKAFGLCSNPLPTLDCTLEEKLLRIRLIAEEFQELQDAISDEDIVKVADALGDLIYVTYGAANAFGIDMEPVEKEIHRSNMSKLQGHVKREDGKVIKPKSYSKPVLEPILRKQQPIDNAPVLVA